MFDNILLILIFIWAICDFLFLYTKSKNDNRDSDNGSAVLLVAIIITGIILGRLVSNYHYLNFSLDVQSFTIGMTLIVLGIFLRIWSMYLLGNSFKGVVFWGKSSQLVEKGPYTLIRHPAYLGTMVIGLGYGIGLDNFASLVVVLATFYVAIIQRIKIEEKVMSKELGNSYKIYRNRTKKLIPFVY